MKTKICGITNVEEAAFVKKSGADFAGIVLFFPKSKRNRTIEEAKELIKTFDNKINTVAVVVSPSFEQAEEIEVAGFNYIQIHGQIDPQIFKELTIPIIKAFNVSDIESFKEYSDNDRVVGYVFDAAEPGSGKTFDWNSIKNIPRDGKMFFLAGGLNPSNVLEAIKFTSPDVVDVSSGVENDNGIGKDFNKIDEFIKNAHISY